MSEDVGRSSSPRRIMKRGSDSIISAVQDVGGAGAGPSEIKKVGIARGAGEGRGFGRGDIELGSSKIDSPRFERQKMAGGEAQTPGGFSSIMRRLARL